MADLQSESFVCGICHQSPATIHLPTTAAPIRGLAGREPGSALAFWCGTAASVLLIAGDDRGAPCEHNAPHPGHYWGP